jgi:uncharacterized tellurite resistance protein B-like protein
MTAKPGSPMPSFMDLNNTPWAGLQYRGDARDILALCEQYNVDGFLAARERDEQESGASLRDRLLKDAVLLNEILSPRIFRIVRQVQDRLGLPGAFDVFCLHGQEINAFAHVDRSDRQARHIIGMTSAALEQLDDAEIASILGHELGHFIFGHSRLLGLVNREERNPKATVLPYLGECLFLQWRKKSEISADRLGLVAAGSFAASARALIKAGFGLSEKNLNLDVEALLGQIETIRDKPETVEATYRSHPLLPLRLKALHLFSTCQATGDPARRDAVEDEIDRLFGWFRRYPRKPLHEAVMRIVALAAMRLAGIEQDVDEEEIRTLVYLLHNYFTDEPEKELVLDPAERQRRWDAALPLIRDQGDDDDRGFIISRLADIALADGKLLEAEAGLILEVAEQIGMAPKRAYAIIVSAAQVVGFRVDAQMKELTRRIRTQLIAPGPGPLPR